MVILEVLVEVFVQFLELEVLLTHFLHDVLLNLDFLLVLKLLLHELLVKLKDFVPFI